MTINLTNIGKAAGVVFVVSSLIVGLDMPNFSMDLISDQLKSIAYWVNAGCAASLGLFLLTSDKIIFSYSKHKK